MPERHEPIAEEEAEIQPLPQPQTSSAGGLKPPGRIGGGTWDDDRWRSAPKEDLNLSMRAYNALRRGGLITVDQILRKSEDELLRLSNLGRKCYDEIRERLVELGIVSADAPWDSARGVN